MKNKMLDLKSEFDLFVGSKIGSFKHVKYTKDSKKNGKKSTENLQELGSLKENDGISCLAWGNCEQTEILLGRKNHKIQAYDLTARDFTHEYVVSDEKGLVRGLCRLGQSLTAALESGVVKTWDESNEESILINVGGHLERMRQSPFDEHVLALGGKETDLQLWDVNEKKQIFNAKNVRHDFLELRVPIWVSDVCFLPESEGKVLGVCSRLGFVRLYDTRAQRRPVCSVEFGELPATCMSASHLERHVVVGFGRGQINQVDLRGKGKPDKGYKGCVGAVTDLFTTEKGPYVVSTSLDRHMRIHDANTKQLLHKQYLTSKLTCLLVQTEGNTPLLNADIVKEETSECTKQTSELLQSDDEYEELFDNMEKIGSVTKEKSKRMPSQPTILEKSTPIRKRKITQEISVEEQQPDMDISIRRLIRSTEKTKKKLTEEKKKKKARSVFHNV